MGCTNKAQNIFSKIYTTYVCGTCNKKFKSNKRCIMHAEWHLKYNLQKLVPTCIQSITEFKLRPFREEEVYRDIKSE